MNLIMLLVVALLAALNGSLANFRRYGYDSPATANGGPPRFWVVRADVIGDPDRRRTFYWEVPNPARPWSWRSALRGHPSEFGVPFRDCLYFAGPLRYALDALTPVIVWAEGEGRGRGPAYVPGAGHDALRRSRQGSRRTGRALRSARHGEGPPRRHTGPDRGGPR